MASLLPRRALLFACIAALAAVRFQCTAFSTTSPASSLALRSEGGIVHRSKIRPLSVKAEDDEDDGDRSRPNIVVIKSHEDYVKFLEEDDRLCVIKFYASWCKSCQRFGLKFRHLAFEEGDRVIGDVAPHHLGEVRFAEVEYSAAAKLCKALRVRKLPTVHMHKLGRGKVADMCCKPSQFQLVVDEVRRQLDGTEEGSAVTEMELPSHAVTEVAEAVATPVKLSNTTGSGNSFDDMMKKGTSLADEIIASMRKDKEGRVTTLLICQFHRLHRITLLLVQVLLPCHCCHT